MMGWEPGNAYIWTGVFLLHLLLYSSSCPLILLKSSHTLTKREREREKSTGEKRIRFLFFGFPAAAADILRTAPD